LSKKNKTVESILFCKLASCAVNHTRVPVQTKISRVTQCWAVISIYFVETDNAKTHGKALQHVHLQRPSQVLTKWIWHCINSYN